MKLKMKTLLLVTVALAGISQAQTTINGSRSIGGSWDASGATTTKPIKAGTSLPATCAVGEMFYKTDATAGSNVYGCTATNTWTAQGGSYSLPIASGSTLGGVKVGTGLSINGSGVLSASGGSSYDPTDATSFGFSDDFVGFVKHSSSTQYNGQIGWFADAPWGGTGYSMADVQQASAGEPDHPGAVQMKTGATSGTGFKFWAGQYGKSGVYIVPSRTNWKGCAVFKVDTLTQVDAWIGVAKDEAVLAPANFVGLHYVATTSAGNWQFATRRYVGGTNADYDTTVAADTNYHRFCVWGDSTTTGKVWMQLDSGMAKSFCASGCDVSATILDSGAAWQFRLKTTESAEKTMTLDWVGVKSTITR